MTDILSLIDNAVRDYETSYDAMRWSPEPPEVPKRRPARLRMDTLAHAVRRQRVIDGPRPGMRLVPFVGGPWHGDLRALPPEWDYRHVLVPAAPSLTFCDEPELLAAPDYITYTLVTGWVDLLHGLVDGAPPAGWRGRIRAARAPGATDADLNEVLWDLLLAGWRPWLSPPSAPDPAREGG